MLNTIGTTYKKFSKNFWLLMAVSLIDMLGRALVFPFFSLFLTNKFNVGMTEAGMMFLVWALSSGLIGNTVGGALADKFGRKANIIFGLVASAASALMMIVIKELYLFYIVIGLIGIFEDIAGPARQAMIADLVPEELLPDAYGIFRIVFNIAAAIGPAIGGFMAAKSFELLFIVDMAISLAVALLVYFLLTETKPESTVAAGEEQTMLEVFKGYGSVFKDKFFVLFILISSLTTLMYFNMNSSLSVFLVNYRGLSPKQFGLIITINAGMVVFLQVLFTRVTSKWRPLLAIVVGNIFYVIGFSMYGIVNSYAMFILAMVVITVGEMIFTPTEQTLVARIAPEDKRGRYMAVRNLSWILPISIGPLGAGLIMDNIDPRFVWLAAGISGLLAIIGFILLIQKAKTRFDPVDREKANDVSKLDPAPIFPGEELA